MVRQYEGGHPTPDPDRHRCTLPHPPQGGSAHPPGTPSVCTQPVGVWGLSAPLCPSTPRSPWTLSAPLFHSRRRPAPAGSSPAQSSPGPPASPVHRHYSHPPGTLVSPAGGPISPQPVPMPTQIAQTRESGLERSPPATLEPQPSLRPPTLLQDTEPRRGVARSGQSWGDERGRHRYLLVWGILAGHLPPELRAGIR